MRRLNDARASFENLYVHLSVELYFSVSKMSSGPPAKSRKLSVKNKADEQKRKQEGEKNTPDVQAFTLQPSIGAEDFLSSLPDDCLYEVFALHDHGDLDVLMYVSQKMNAFSVHARPNAPNGVIEELKIKMISQTEYRVNFSVVCHEITKDYNIKNSCRGVNCRGCAVCTQKAASVRRGRYPYQATDNISVLHQMFAYIKSIPDRYDFNTIKIDSVLLDGRFRNFCMQFLKTPRKRLIFDGIYGDPSNAVHFGPINAPPHHIMIVLYEWMSKVNKLELTSPDLSAFDPDRLLRYFASKVQHPSAHIGSVEGQFESWNGTLRGQRTLYDFVDYVDFHVEYLIFGTYSFMPAIVERYRKGRAGEWYVLISTELTAAAMNRGLPQGMTVTQSVEGNRSTFVIETNGRKIITIKHIEIHGQPGTRNAAYEMAATFHE